MEASKPYTQSDSAQHMYGARASNYDDSFHPSFAKHIVDSLELQPGERLLDLACGTGLVTLTAADAIGPTGSVIGIDITQAMLNELQTKITNAPKDQYKNVTIHNHDITRLHEMPDLKKDSFDAISCTSALVLLSEPGVALQNWAEYLKPGGRIIVDVTDGDSLPEGTAMELVYHRLGVDPPFRRLWSKDAASLRRILQQSGLDVERTWSKEPRELGTRYLDVEGWEKRFENTIYTPPNKALVDRGLVEQARPLFKEEWTKLAVHDGKIKDYDAVWIGIARKPAPMDPVAKGSCACGAIHWTAYDQSSGGSNCFCVTCRKISGSPYITFLDVPQSRLLFSPPHGKPFMKTYTASPHAERGFCGECGSTLTMWYRKEPDLLAIAVGSLDEDESETTFFKGSKRHIYVKDVPHWYTLPDDGLERQETMKSAGRLLSDE